MVESLILLVGSNPLPNYLAAMALKPAKVHLVYSGETEPPRNRLRDALNSDLAPGTSIDADVFIGDAFSASDVATKIAGLMHGGPERLHLHYTGGTKVMSAHALKAFHENGGDERNASYLDEANIRLRFDNGDTRSLSDCGVTLSFERLLALHGLDHKPRATATDGPTETDIEAIAKAELKDPTLQEKLHKVSCDLKKHKDKPNKAIPNAFDPATCDLSLTAAKIPTADWTKERFKAWWRFLGGEWLEDWVAGRVRAVAPKSEVAVGVDCKRYGSGRELEVDVVAIRAQRSYFISCTTDQKLGQCKLKAFEIAARSRQMGGDLSRSALVCLLHGEDSKGKFVDQLRADVADVWGATNTTAIFGLEDLRTWAGDYGLPNLDALKKWLEL